MRIALGDLYHERDPKLDPPPCPKCEGRGYVSFKNKHGFDAAKECVCRSEVTPMVERTLAQIEKTKLDARGVERSGAGMAGVIQRDFLFDER